MAGAFCSCPNGTGERTIQMPAKRRLSIFALWILGGAALAGIPRAEAGDPPGEIPGLRHFEVQRLTRPAVASDSTVLFLTIDGQPRTLRLYRQSLRSPDFQVLVQGADGVLREFRGVEPATYRGSLDGVPEAHVAASFLPDGLHARIEIAEDDIWNIQPLSSVAAASDDPDAHVVFHRNNVLPVEHGCEAVAGEDPGAGHAASTDSGSTAGVGVTVVDIAFDADFEFFKANGNSVAATVNDIEAVMNQVALIYENQFNLTFEITTIVIRTAEPDPYTSTNNQTLLNEFRNEWNMNRTHVHRDIAHLMTGKNVDGNVIGTAFTGTMCQVCGSAQGYGFSESRFTPLMVQRACLTAHELGHNFGAVHCDGDADCYVMCSMIGSCGGSCTQFGSRSKLSINNGIQNAACFSELSPPAELPFCETFESGIDPARWSYNAIASISSGGLNPPSGFSSLLLDTCCTGCSTAPDEIRSNYIRLGGSSQATLSYFTQHAGGAGTAGSQLIIEFWNLAGDWIELNRITSNGTTQSTFTLWQHALPPDALHDAFRVRFRQGGLASQANWYLDNVSITNVNLDSPVLYVRADAPGGDGSSWSTAFQDLQAALSAAACSQGVVKEVWVAAGTYRPDRGTGDRNASFLLLNGVEIYGGFRGTEKVREERRPDQNVTILSGEIGSLSTIADNSYHVVVATGADPSAVLDGFTIIRGNANGTTPNHGGGGLYNAAGSPTLRNLTFRDNNAVNGGAIYDIAGTATLIGCRFVNNSATNWGGAMYNTSGSTPLLNRCLFVGNFASQAGGAVFNSSSAANFYNSVFSGNIGGTGGAIQNSGSSAHLQNCTFSRNGAIAFGGGMFNNSSFATVINSVFWGNYDVGGINEASQFRGFGPTIDFSCVQGWTGGFGGTGNSGTDPRFVDSDGSDNIVGTVDDDLRLRSDSPAINMGDPSYLFAHGERDFDGHARVLCGRIDSGAFEFGIGDHDCSRVLNASDAAFDECLTGPGLGPYAAGCEALDFNGDGDVDLDDMAAFWRLTLTP